MTAIQTDAREYRNSDEITHISIEGFSMSEKLDGIDLNSDAVPIEANNKICGGVDWLDSERRVTNCDAETPMEHSISWRQSRGSLSATGVVDEAGFSGGVSQMVGGLVEEGLDVDTKCADGGFCKKIVDESIAPTSGHLGGEEGLVVDQAVRNDAGNDLGLKIDKNPEAVVSEMIVNRIMGNAYIKEERGSQASERLARQDDCMGMEAETTDVGRIETKAEKDNDQVKRACDSESGVSSVDMSDMLNLFVDLTSRIDTDGNWNCKTEGGNKGIMAKEVLDDSNASLLSGVSENVHSRINDDSRITKQDGTNGKDFVLPALNAKCSGSESETEIEGGFHVSDLVWGKVRSHPWWPGQIFHHSAASDNAMKYFKKGGYLIAYFGDQTFAWNEASRIKPLEMNFSQMDKQSSMESFCHAVNCALGEVSRRVEFGLACPCLLEDVYAKIKAQVVVNAGIREESSRRDGGDNLSNAASFRPVELIHYMKTLAQGPLNGLDRLEFVTARAQLLSFNRWKGMYELPSFVLLGGLLEKDTDIAVLEQENGSAVVPDDAVPGFKPDKQDTHSKGKKVIEGRSSKKRKHISTNGVGLSKKERCMSDLLLGSSPCLENGEDNSELTDMRAVFSTSGTKCKADDVISNDSKVGSSMSSMSLGTVNDTSSPPKKFSRVGDRISRVASQLTRTSLMIKDGYTTVPNTADINYGKPAGSTLDVSTPSAAKSQRIKVISVEYPSPDEMLSQLCLAAGGPMRGHSCLFSIVRFFSDFRNSVCLENLHSGKDRRSAGKMGDEQVGKKSSNSGTAGTDGVEGFGDSYWTDRIIQNTSKEQVLFHPQNLVDKGAPAVEPEPEPVVDSSPKSYYKQETTVLYPVMEAEEPVRQMDETSEEYSFTALILKFTDFDSIPSKSKLNEIFSHYGPLNESETEVLRKSKQVKVVFKRRSDAETAFSRSGKFKTFGPSLVSYRLKVLPERRQVSASAPKRKRKNAASVEGLAV